MIAYVLDSKTLLVKDTLEFEQYLFADDIEYRNKSWITAVKQPNIQNNDFVVCKDGAETLFAGICTDYNSKNKTVDYKLTLRPMACLFDRTIFPSGAYMIRTSIEAFIVKAIEDNWIDSGDAFTDLSYLSASASTTTPVAASLGTISGSNGEVYNLKTFLGNAKERYGIFTDFMFSGIPSSPALAVTVRKDSAAALSIDLLTTDVVTYDETYDVDVLAKLNVRWIPDVEPDDRTFYLLNNRTISTDPDDPDRAAGVTKSIVDKSYTEAEMLDAVTQEFASNKYSHRITFDVLRRSNLYDVDAYYVGRPCTVKTKSGIRTSMITATVRESGSATVHVELGKLKVTLIDKLRSKT